MIYTGISIGMIEIGLYMLISSFILCSNKNLRKMDLVSYFWSTMTVLTGIWEFFYIYNYDKIVDYSNNLLVNKEHVWTNNYSLSHILPNELSSIFYAEYGAYADREYMTLKNDWSRIIESTHALFCGLFSLLALYNKTKGNNKNFNICFSISMGSQLMNSILYMSNYLIEVHNPTNINFNTTEFPCGLFLLKRPFMYVNLFWLFMPLYSIFSLLV